MYLCSCVYSKIWWPNMRCWSEIAILPCRHSQSIRECHQREKFLRWAPAKVHKLGTLVGLVPVTKPDWLMNRSVASVMFCLLLLILYLLQSISCVYSQMCTVKQGWPGTSFPISTFVYGRHFFNFLIKEAST